MSPFPRMGVGTWREVSILLDACGDDWRRAMDEALEYESAAGDRPLEGSWEEDVGTGRGLEGEEVCRCSHMVARGLLQLGTMA